MKRKGENLKEVLNMLISLFWTILFLGPVAWFCYQYLSLSMILIIFSISLIAYFLKPVNFNFALPTSWIKLVGKITQDGGIVNFIMRKRYADYKVIRSKDDIKKYRSQTRIREAFHLQMCLLFWILFFYALFLKLWGWAIFIFASNLLYNIWPLLFLQYMRRRFRKK